MLFLVAFWTGTQLSTFQMNFAPPLTSRTTYDAQGNVVSAQGTLPTALMDNNGAAVNTNLRAAMDQCTNFANQMKADMGMPVNTRVHCYAISS